MVQVTTRVLKRSPDVLALEVRVVRKDLVLGLPGGEQIKDIGNADAHAANAGSTATNGGIDGDSFHYKFSIR